MLKYYKEFTTKIPIYDTISINIYNEDFDTVLEISVYNSFFFWYFQYFLEIKSVIYGNFNIFSTVSTYNIGYFLYFVELCFNMFSYYCRVEVRLFSVARGKSTSATAQTSARTWSNITKTKYVCFFCLYFTSLIFLCYLNHTHVLLVYT